MADDLSDKRILATVVSFFFWGAFGISVAAVSQSSYIYYDVYEEGLFSRITTGVANSMQWIERTSWLDATAAMMIIGVVFDFSAAFGLQFLVNWAGVTKGGTNLNAWKAVALFSVIGAWCYTIGISVYTGFVEQGYAGSGNTYNAAAARYGAGFGMAWGGAALSNIAATLAWYIVKDLTPERLEAARAAALERMQEVHSGKCCA